MKLLSFPYQEGIMYISDTFWTLSEIWSYFRIRDTLNLVALSVYNRSALTFDSAELILSLTPGLCRPF